MRTLQNPGRSRWLTVALLKWFNFFCIVEQMKRLSVYPFHRSNFSEIEIGSRRRLTGPDYKRVSQDSMKHSIHRPVLIILLTTVEFDRSASSDTYHSVAMISCSVSTWWLRILPLFHSPSPWYSMTTKQKDFFAHWSPSAFVRMNACDDLDSASSNWISFWWRIWQIIVGRFILFWPWSFSLSTFNFIRKVSTRKENKYYLQVRWSYLTYATHLCRLLLCISHIIIIISTWNSSDDEKKNSTVIVWSKEKSIRLILLDLIMNHEHDHAAMLANTTLSANLGDHVMDHGMHSAAAASGHSLHSKDMMMMAVSDFFWADRSDVSFEKHQKELHYCWITVEYLSSFSEQMTFHGGYTESILFDQWSTKTVGGK